jgi:hypothetical protein
MAVCKGEVLLSLLLYLKSPAPFLPFKPRRRVFMIDIWL